MQPVIKWTGSKRSQANELIKLFPGEMKTYYEPFCGGASVLRTLLDNIQEYTVERFVCCDIDKNLINLWNAIKDNPEKIIDDYIIMWKELNLAGTIERRWKIWGDIRTRLNLQHNPSDFMFITRTATNGMTRYNSKGEFNNSFHITRIGMNPETLKKIVFDWSNILNRYNVNFELRSYLTLNPEEGDFCYLDPPYYNTKAIYQGGFDSNKLFEWIRNLKCGYVWSYNGISGDKDNTALVPEDLYDRHIYLKSGNSSFKRTTGKDKNAMVYESVYIKSR